MKKNKVDWKDRDLITRVVLASTSYAEALKMLGLKPVSANTTTLKKYINSYNISTEHFGKTDIVPMRVQNDNIQDMDTPEVRIYHIVEDPKKGIGIEIDWNDAFIDYLRANGYIGVDENQIIQKYIISWLQHVQLQEAESGVSEFEN